MKFKFTQYLKSIKAPSPIYADLDSLIKKIIGFKSNPEKWSARKPDKHIPCSYKISAIWIFYNIEKMNDVNREKERVSNFCEYLQDQVIKQGTLKKKKWYH